MLLVSISLDYFYLAVCGGGGSCGSYHIILPKDIYGSLPPVREQEKELLSTVVMGATPT